MKKLIFSQLIPSKYKIPIQRKLKLKIPCRYFCFNPYRLPFGSYTWTKEPGIQLPASPGVLSEEYVTQEHTQSTGPGIRSIYDSSPYIQTYYSDKRPSITKEEF